jgi:hypothetical protein
MMRPAFQSYSRRDVILSSSLPNSRKFIKSLKDTVTYMATVAREQRKARYSAIPLKYDILFLTVVSSLISQRL